MFSSALRATLIALAASAVSVAAAPGLSLAVSGSNSFTGAENMKVVTTITNTGDETLKLINDPRGALHSLPTNAFAITSEAGEVPAFVGAKAKFSLETAAASASDEGFTVLAPGASFTITHDLSQAYNFTNSGESTYTIEPSNLFHYVDAEGNVKELRADAEAHVAKLTGSLAVAHNFQKRASYNGCSSSRQSALVSAASSAQSYAASALSYLNSHTSSTTRYTTWFGTYTSSRHSTVQSHFSKISASSYASFTYDCTCTDSGTYAYVYPNDFGVIYLCGAFWQAPNTGTDSRAGTLIHESSHFTAHGGTDDIVYGQSGAKSLAKSNPSQAVMNADSHEYFAENNPAQS